MLNNSMIFKYTHKMTRKIINMYGGDYRTQFGICLKYIRGMCKLSVSVYNYNRDMRDKFDKMQKVCDYRYWNITGDETKLCEKCPNRDICKRILKVDTGSLIMDYSLDKVVSQFVVNRHIDWKGVDKDIDFYISCFDGNVSEIVKAGRLFTNYYNNVERKLIVNI